MILFRSKLECSPLSVYFQLRLTFENKAGVYLNEAPTNETPLKV
jgi:hypothetical protein